MCCLGGTMSHVLGPNNVYLGYFCLAKYQNHEYYYFKVIVVVMSDNRQ